MTKKLLVKIKSYGVYPVIALIVFAIIFAFGVWANIEQSNSLENTTEAILQQQAINTGLIISKDIESVKDSKIIQENLEKSANTISQIQELTVYLPDGSGNFSVIASTNSERIGLVESDAQKVKALETKKVITYQKEITTGEQAGTNYNMIPLVPILGEEDEVIALLEVIYNTDDSNALVNIYARNNTLFIFLITTGALVLTIALAVNLVRIKLIKEDADAKIKHKDELLATAAHDLGGSLVVVKQDISKLLEEWTQLGSDVINKLLIEIRDSANYLSNFLQDLLIISRFERGKKQVFPRPEFLQETLEQMINQFGPQATKKGLKLNLIGDITKLPKVIIDPGKVGEVFMNYLSNAIKYSDTGVVTIKVYAQESKKKHYIVVSVTDQGVGISAEDQKKLFQSFSRVGETQKTHKGTGLGLYIAKLIIEAHGGQIGVSSVLGQGSTFFFSIPIPSSSDIAELEQAKKKKSIA